MRRRVLLEDLLLLALRTLAVLAAVLALAQPGAERAPAWLARAARSEIIVLDASLSMNHRTGGESAFERAVVSASARLQEADPLRGAQGAVIVAGLRAERIAAGDPTAARAALQQLQAAGAGRADLAGALEAALRTGEDFGAGAPPRVTVYTDLQASTWDLETQEMPALARLVQAGVTLEIVDVGARVRDNVAVTALDLAGARWIRGDTVDAVAHVRNFGAAAADVRAECLLAGDPVAAETLHLEPGAAADWPLQLQPRAAGVRAVEVRLAHDGLAEDDARAAVFALTEALDMVIVGEPAPRDQPPGVADALIAYLDLGEGAPLRPAVVAPAALDARAMADAEVVALADPGSIGAGAAAAIAAFVARGGGLLIALGPRTGAAELGALQEALGSAAVEVLAPRTAEDPFARLIILDEQHPALRFFLEPRWRPLLTEVPFRTWRPLRVAEGAEARSLLAFTRGEAFADEGAALVEERAGPGTVAWLAAAPCSTWNRMEEVPSGTLALLYDLVFRLAPAPGFPPAVEVGQALAVTLPAAPTEVILRDPAGARFPTPPALSAAPGAHLTQAVLLPAAEQPGVWRVEASLPEEDGSERRLDLRLAVNVPPEESDLRPADEETLRALLPAGVRLAADGAEAAEAAQDPVAGRADYSRIVWQIVLALLVGETLLAALLDRRRQ